MTTWSCPARRPRWRDGVGDCPDGEERRFWKEGEQREGVVARTAWPSLGDVRVVDRVAR